MRLSKRRLSLDYEYNEADRDRILLSIKIDKAREIAGFLASLSIWLTRLGFTDRENAYRYDYSFLKKLSTLLIDACGYQERRTNENQSEQNNDCSK